MILRAVAGEALFECSDFDLTREGPTYSIQTIEHFAELLGPESSLCWIIGEDALAELVTWRQAERLLDRCSVLTASRPGFSGVDEARLGSVFSGDQIERLKAGVVETPRIDISSTNIRARVGDGRSIRFLVPDAVWEYIDEHHLYRTG
jgi:nicotinate-nucleotide adenylyltransferase